MFKPGDRVDMNDRGLRQFSQSKARHGTIVRRTRRENCWAVKWDELATTWDALHENFLRPTEPKK